MTGPARTKPSLGRIITYVLTGAALFLIVFALLYAQAFGPVSQDSEKVQFLVSPDETVTQVADDLEKQGFVRGAWIFQIAFLRATDGKGIRPGGYEISKGMDAWSIASALVAPPYFAWVKIPVGVRKEQIANILTNALGWTDEQKKEWLTVDTNTGPNYVEGVYFPDTYLIPTDQPPAVVAQRMRDRFKEAFAPYADEAVKQKVAWPKILTIASIIQREAGSVEDMGIISGVIQKRLAVGMPLAMDATLQYIEGNDANKWWPSPKAANTYPNTPFNTYKQKGLPPHPIANPGLAAINAALHPTATNCLFYLHDPNGQIHCSTNYSGQLSNVQKYLK
ncbi:MAG: Endolytic murein transglycosylase [Parcubacteria group bacterium]|nr:Endolytic murein transglycosylase [Parcubacteria group bacterium]